MSVIDDYNFFTSWPGRNGSGGRPGMIFVVLFGPSHPGRVEGLMKVRAGADFSLVFLGLHILAGSKAR